MNASAEHRGPPDVLAAFRVPGVHAGALDTEEHEDGDQHRALDLLEQRPVPDAAPQVAHEHGRVEGEEREQDEDQDIEAKAFTRDELRRMIAGGEIIDLKTIAGLSLVG